MKAPLGLLASACSAMAILFPSTGDPSFNASDYVAAWSLQGTWQGGTGTPISQRDFITARHLGGGAGNIFSLGTNSYIVESVSDNGDLRICRVAGEFETWAKLNDQPAESNLRVHGRGAGRGDPIYGPAWTTNYTTLKTLGMTRKQVLCAWPFSEVHGQDVVLVRPRDNSQPIGWLWGTDYRLRWGTARVSSSSTVLACDFEAADATSCGLANGDSGGGAFVFNGSEWLLAGVARGVTDSGASYLDKRWICTLDGACYQDFATPIPSRFYFTRIYSYIDWINSVINQPAGPM